MFDRLIRRDDWVSINQLNDLLQKFNLKQEQPVVIEKRRNYTWLIVLGIVLGVAAIGITIYKCFFEYDEYDEYDDFDEYDDDFDDIDYDEDYEDEDFDEDIDIAEDEE